MNDAMCTHTHITQCGGSIVNAILSIIYMQHQWYTHIVLVRSGALGRFVHIVIQKILISFNVNIGGCFYRLAALYCIHT